MKETDDGNVVGMARPETVDFFREHLVALREVELEIDQVEMEAYKYVEANKKFLILSRYLDLQDKLMRAYEKRAMQYSREIMEKLGTFSKMLGDQFGIAPEERLYHLDPETGVVTLVEKERGANVSKGA